MDKVEDKIVEYTFTPTKAGTYTFRFWAGKIVTIQINL